MWVKGEDVMEGRGILIYAGGSRFDGYFENNGVGSYGRLITKDGEVYIGQFKDGLQHG